MDAAQIVGAFARLPSNKTRLEALSGIVDCLERDEWLHVARLLRAKWARYDILGNLPLELVILVLSHLPRNHLLLLQQVSRTWKSVLSSKAVLAYSLVGRWYPVDKPLWVEPALADSDNATTYRLRLEYLNRLCTGRFLNYVKCDAPRRLGNGSGESRLISLSDDALAWGTDGVNGGHRGFIYFNLRSGHTSSIIMPGREVAQYFVLTNDLIAFTTYTSRCYVQRNANSTNGELRSFRIPSPWVKQLVGSGQMVVGLIKTPHQQAATVFVWDDSTQQSTLFPAWSGGNPLASSSYGLAISRYTNSIIVIKLQILTRSMFIIRHSASGKCLGICTVTVADEQDFVRLSDVGLHGVFHILLKHRDGDLTRTYEYDEITNVCRMKSLVFGVHQSWKGAEYCIEKAIDENALRITCSDASRTPPFEKTVAMIEEEPALFLPWNESRVPLFNGRYLVYWSAELHIWGFERHCPVPVDALWAAFHQTSIEEAREHLKRR